MGTQSERNGPDGRQRQTPSRLPLETVYPTARPSDLPGEFPFTRGIHADMYRGRLWTMRQYAGFGDPHESNRRFRYLLAQGQAGLSVAFDLPTQIGYDSDDPMALGEVGKVGVPISCAGDLDALLEGIPLENVSVSMTINSTAAMLLAFLVAVAERRRVPLDALRGTLQNDMLKEFIARGTYRFPLAPSLRLTTDILEFCQQRLPRWNPISVSGYHMREAGCTAVEEIGFGIANALAYLELARQRGLELAPLTRRLSFFWAAHNHVLEEVAKFRAARRLWADLVRHRVGLTDPRCARMRFHVQTAGSTLTAQEPENNVVRVALQAAAAVLGGAQSLHTNGMDEALGLPSELSARTALRTQQIIAYESGLADVADPLGGAAAIEQLTDGVENEARRIVDDIEERGGALKTVEEGYQQSVIEEEAYRHLRAVESGERIVVGVNRFAAARAQVPGGARYETDPRSERRRVDELRRLKGQRRDGAVQRTLRALEGAARSSDNLIIPLLECARTGATVGEMSTTLSDVFGEYRG